jgi:chemotaxis protein histidine kinase CheA
MSSRKEVSDISGRGVGFSAISKAVEASGGVYYIQSIPGEVVPSLVYL